MPIISLKRYTSIECFVNKNRGEILSYLVKPNCILNKNKISGNVLVTYPVNIYKSVSC